MTLSPRDLLFRGLIPLLTLLVLWQTIAYVAQGIGLSDIAAAFIKLSLEGDSEGHYLSEHVTVSMTRVAVGFLIAAGTAIPLGVAVGRYRLASAMIGPVVEAMRPIPPIAWIPISILLFRSNFFGAQVFIIWIGAFFPILLNTTAGVKRTLSVHLDVASTFGASEAQVLQKIVIPSAAPEVFAGLRIGFGIGWMCLVAAEMIGGSVGLGHLVLVTQQVGQTGQTIAAMLLIGLIGFLITYASLYMERHALVWRRDVSV
ncbi:MAG: ABC transporter permease [Candidatus Thorarchaeota archaeon]|nr:ABC transporter permease [Candidatus Thorarchaeota archaeon]